MAEMTPLQLALWIDRLERRIEMLEHKAAAQAEFISSMTSRHAEPARGAGGGRLSQDDPDTAAHQAHQVC